MSMTDFCAIYVVFALVVALVVSLASLTIGVPSDIENIALMLVLFAIPATMNVTASEESQ